MSTPRLYIYINPHSGTKLALRTYKKELEPKLKSRDNVTVIFTEFSGHCMDHVQGLDLSSRVLIVTLSGDGLFFEALNGLYKRKDWSETKENVSLGIIPCGTGNALACSMVRQANESYEGDFGLSLALRNVLSSGEKSMALDLIEIELSKEKMKVLSFIGVTIGLIADVDIGTECIRCMGYLRAYLMVAWRICKPKSYKAKVSYLPLERDGLSGKPIPPQRGSTLSMPSLDDPNLPPDWVSETDSYVLIYADNLPLLDSVTLFAPDSQLNDGIIQLVIVRTGLSRKEMLDWFLHPQRGDYAKKEQVDIIPVRAFRIEPIKPEGFLAVDGESFQFGTVQGQILPNEVKLMVED